MSPTDPSYDTALMHLGALSLESNLFLSPLAGYTNLPFRLTVRELGGLDLATTDLVNARSLLENNSKALKLVETCLEDRPLSVQLFGAVAEEMRDAALMLQERGIASIDINMGCPVRKVVKVGGGSAMMTEWQKTAALVQTMVEALRIPVTAKMRLGWDERNITAPHLAQALEGSGIAAVFVHGRTREQGFSGVVNLDGIAKVVRAVKKIPIIGNGDVTTPQSARHMMEWTGCHGVSVGRGAFYNPWIFQHTQSFLATGRLPPEPSFEERLRVMRRHLTRMVEVFGEAKACMMFRKVGPWYAKRFGPANHFNKRIVHLKNLSEFEDVLSDYIRWRSQFLDEDGLLKVQYQPDALLPTFMEDQPTVARREHIPVPKGPVEVW